MPAALRPSQIGAAADVPSDSKSGLWRYINNLVLSFSTIRSDLGSSKSKDALNPSDLRESGTDPTRATSLGYVLLNQLVTGQVFKSASTLGRLGLSLSGQPVNDRKLLLEDVVQFLATSAVHPGYGPNKPISNVQADFIGILWKDLPHPPAGFVGDQFRFRTADDSFVSLNDPKLGAAGQPYARSVPPRQILPANIATPEEIFDACLRRPEGSFTPHPSGISSLLFGHALLVIHSCMWTSQEDPNINLAPSYLSLSPLYGTNAEEQAKVRDHSKLGRGLLYPDTFSSSRILMIPPSASAMLLLYSRNHNRVAKKLLEINELGIWNKDLSKLTAEQKQKQDDQIFGYARNINCKTFVDVTLKDYVQTILGTIQADSDWSLDPRIDQKTLMGKTPSGIGNAVSLEFNVIYRWHAVTSEKDTRWLEDKVAVGRPDRNWDKMTLAEFGVALNDHAVELGVTFEKDAQGKPISSKPLGQRHWKLSKYETPSTSHKDKGKEKQYESGVYTRGHDGKFKDEDIAKTLRDATNEVAGAYGAKHIPAVFKAIDTHGMRIGRGPWHLCTLNEFRKFMGLTTYSTFEQWNPDPAVARAAESLWGHPDNIELYAGLMAEATKDPRIGAGLCPGYTLSRAILSDATALVRGDRFFTHDSSADTLTQWGLEDTRGGTQLGAYGGIMSKLISENLPNQYVFNDVALHFPFQTPARSMEILKGISKDKAADYIIGRGPPENFKLPPDAMLVSPDYRNLQAQRMRDLTGNPALRVHLPMVFTALNDAITFAGSEWDLLADAVDTRIDAATSVRAKVKTVDIVKDVTTPICVGWLAGLFGVLQTGVHSQIEIAVSVSNLYHYLHQTPQTDFASRIAAREACAKLHAQLLTNATSFSPAQSLVGFVGKVIDKAGLNVFKILTRLFSRAPNGAAFRSPEAATDFYARLATANAEFNNPFSPDELASNCMQAFAILGRTLSHGVAQAIDALLGENESDLAKMTDLGKHALTGQDPKARRKLVQKALSAARVDHSDDADGSVSRFLQKGLEAVLPVILGLPHIRRAPGQQGHFNQLALTDQIGGISSLVVQYG